MTKIEAEEKLSELESNLFEALYRSRWDSSYAERVVEDIILCLEIDDKSVLHRSLLALSRIGPMAQSATERVISLMFHADDLISEVAVHTLGGICLKQPERVIKPLTQVASNSRLQKSVLHVLSGFGAGAKPANQVFVDAFESKDARIRQLAVQGLRRCGAGSTICAPILSRALKDSNGKVRLAAGKLKKSLKIEKGVMPEHDSP